MGMSFIESHLLSAIVFLPLIGAIILLTFPRHESAGARGFALAVGLLDLGLAAWMCGRFDPSLTGIQLREMNEWIPSLGISYAVGVDGIAVLLVVLTTFLAPIVILSTYSSVSERIRDYLICLLALQTGMLGVFLATDLFLFYVFWEVILVPMYFLIGLWGGHQRIHATLKFFLYTMSGSLLMLVAILYCVWAVRHDGGLTFSFVDVAERLTRRPLGAASGWLFLAFALAFAIKVPMFPFHTWLPEAHVEAPTGGSVILAGVLLKLGTFGFLRYAMWLFPRTAADFMPAIGLLAVVGIIYGALLAMVQDDLKRIVAYSSVSHLGFVMLGIAAMTTTSVTGSVLQMVNHGISTGALFLLVGVIYERRHTRQLDDFGGIAKVMPRYATVFVLMALSSAGLPGLNGFVGEFLILVGTFRSTGLSLQATTGDIAWGAITVIGLLAVVGVGGVLVALSQLSQRPDQEQVGPRTRFAALTAVAALAFVIAAPPVFGFGGGLLIRPLTSMTSRTDYFAETFAVLAGLATLGVILSAVYLLFAIQRVFFGPISHPENAQLADLSVRERTVLAPLVIAAILMGLFPKPLIDVIEPTVANYTQQFRLRAGLAPISEPTLYSDATALPLPRRSLVFPSLPGAIRPTMPGLPPELTPAPIGSPHFPTAQVRQRA